MAAIVGSTRHWDPGCLQSRLGSLSGLPHHRYSEHQMHEQSQVWAATSGACLLCESEPSE